MYIIRGPWALMSCLATDQSYWSCTYALFPPRWWWKSQVVVVVVVGGGAKWGYFCCCSTGSRFRDIECFWKFLPWNLKFHIPHGVEIELIFSLRAAVSEIRADFQNCHIWAWNLAIGESSRSCTYTAFLTKGSKLTLFSLYGQQFPRYGSIFKIAIFGHESWQVAKVPEFACIPSFYPRGSKFSLFLL